MGANLVQSLKISGSRGNCKRALHTSQIFRIIEYSVMPTTPFLLGESCPSAKDTISLF